MNKGFHPLTSDTSNIMDRFNNTRSENMNDESVRWQNWSQELVIDVVILACDAQLWGPHNSLSTRQLRPHCIAIKNAQSAPPCVLVAWGLVTGTRTYWRLLHQNASVGSRFSLWELYLSRDDLKDMALIAGTRMACLFSEHRFSCQQHVAITSTRHPGWQLKLHKIWVERKQFLKL